MKDALNFFIVKQLPVLPPETYTPARLDLIIPRVLELAYTAIYLEPFARDLGYAGNPFPWDEDRRALLRADLDGIYAHLYRLDRDDFDYTLDQFPVVRCKDESAHGEYRTMRLCLESYDYFSRPAREKLRTADEDIEVRLKKLVIARLRDDLLSVPEDVQAAQEAVRGRQSKPLRASSLSDFLGAAFLPMIGTVIRANFQQFDDHFATNKVAKDHVGALVALRNELAHPQDQ